MIFLFRNCFFSKDIRIYFSLLFYSICVLFIVSPDSYTHDLYSRCDSAWFYMCGKAWMNGMLPYVDFSDSKGPLLWLIYGIGYLISPSNYIGVFWLSSICYSITFFFCYKIGFLLSKSISKGFAISVLMSIPYFWHDFHYEIRAEDWCHPFVVSSLYVLLKIILSPKENYDRISGLVFGLSLASTLLMKWSIAVMLLSIIGSALLILLFRKKSCIRFIFFTFLSAFIFSLPFYAYLVINGCFEEFLNEYFINTTKTVSNGSLQDTFFTYLQELKGLFSVRFVFIIYLIFGFLYYLKHKTTTLLPLLCSIFFLGISIHHDRWMYYMTISSTFSIWLFLFVFDLIPFRINKLFLSAIVLISLIINTWNLRYHDNLFFQDSDTRISFYKASYLLSQIDNPLIINSGNDYGIGILSNSLPGTKYWALQNGAIDEMCISRWNDVNEGKPDFLILSSYGQKFEDIRDKHYCYYLSCRGEVGVPVEIWGRPGLHLPPDDFSISMLDVLLKKKISFDKN